MSDLSLTRTDVAALLGLMAERDRVMGELDGVCAEIEERLGLDRGAISARYALNVAERCLDERPRPTDAPMRIVVNPEAQAAQAAAAQAFLDERRRLADRGAEAEGEAV